MLAQSPWLVQPKSGCLSVIGHLLDSHTLSDNSWGWAYRSDQSWIQQHARTADLLSASKLPRCYPEEM
ncbi:unnamed protein product [Photorhabdus laumondii subsp. laumondii TTO1]|uniref:Photorhabdus luminescens subsp. laumondii TTO1 complete genome segment 3/17 n=1 Tax=Photorhabdus laumondii subsp. laumondii (strain DSM 15139 / CIP 105565 / TT01) TaxID=243265 RepID=Q7N8G0_PHOLL|nr:unnamed protein product [Photorhabdus laumondii subsp. laumondii TTO1]